MSSVFVNSYGKILQIYYTNNINYMLGGCVMQGIEFVVMKRSGKCQCCKKKLRSGVTSVILGSFSNKYRYCIQCFCFEIEDNLVIGIYDLINKEEIVCE